MIISLGTLRGRQRLLSLEPLGVDCHEREGKVSYAGTFAGTRLSEILGVCVLHVHGFIRHKILHQEKVFLLSDGQKTLAPLLSRTHSTLASSLGSSPNKTLFCIPG